MPPLIRKTVLELLSITLTCPVFLVYFPFFYNIQWYSSLKVKYTSDLDIMILLKF